MNIPVDLREMNAFLDTRMCRGYVPFIVAPLEGFGGPSTLHCTGGLWPIPNIIWSFISLAILEGVRFLNFSDYMYEAWDIRLSTLAPFTFLPAVCVEMQGCRSAEMVVSIHWTLIRNFYFIHKPLILHFLKAITKYRLQGTVTQYWGVSHSQNWVNTLRGKRVISSARSSIYRSCQ